MRTYTNVHAVTALASRISNASGPLTGVAIEATNYGEEKYHYGEHECMLFLTDVPQDQRGQMLRAWLVQTIDELARNGVCITGVSYQHDNGITRFVGGSAVETPVEANPNFPHE